MNNEELKELLIDLTETRGESEILEFKVNNFDPDTLGKLISGISNSLCIKNKKSGYIIYGVEDDTKKIVGSTQYLRVVKPTLEGYLVQKIRPKINFEIFEFEYDDKKISIVKVPPPVNSPVCFNRVGYVRIGSSLAPLSDSPLKEQKIWANLQKSCFEENLIKENIISENVLEILDYDSFFRLTNQKLPSTTSKFVDNMVEHGLVAKSFGNKFDITNLGAILFVNDFTSISSIKKLGIRVVKYKGNSRNNIEKGKIFNYGHAICFEDVVDYIKDQVPKNEEIISAFRKEKNMYPIVAIREFIANAIIHQDLNGDSKGPIVEIFDDRIEITNNGVPLIPTNRFIDYPPKARNSVLASFMREIGVCEELGSGIDRAIDEISLFQLPAPRFDTYGESSTKITMYSYKKLKDMADEDKIRACFQHCVLMYVNNKRMTNSSLRKRLGIKDSNYPTASTIIKKTKEKDLIKQSDKDKEYIPKWA